MVKFSFVVPVYNIKQEYLKQCMNSLLGQTIKSFEILLIDDGSTNGADQWCDLYGTENKEYVRVFHKKNEGVSTARNIGILESKGEYLIFVDPDDWVDLEICEKIDSILDSYDFDVLTYFYYTEYTDSSKIEEKYEDGSIHKLTDKEQGELIQQLIDTKRKAEYNYFHSTIFGAVWGKCFKRSFILENNIQFKKELIKSEDTIFNLNAFFAAKTVIEYNFPLYHYRMVKSSVSHRYNAQIEKIQLLFLGAVKEFLQNYRLSDLYQEAFIHRCISSYFTVLQLDIFNRNNDDRTREKRIRWKSFINTEYIKNISLSSLRKYPWRMRLFFVVTKMHLFYVLQLLYNLRNKTLQTDNQNNVFD